MRIMDGYERINDAEDYRVQFQCGCEVVFLGSCFHRSSRMTTCVEHGRKDEWWKRGQIRNAAKRQLDHAKMMQPPR